MPSLRYNLRTPHPNHPYDIPAQTLFLPLGSLAIIIVHPTETQDMLDTIPYSYHIVNRVATLLENGANVQRLVSIIGVPYHYWRIYNLFNQLNQRLNVAPGQLIRIGVANHLPHHADPTPLIF